MSFAWAVAPFTIVLLTIVLLGCVAQGPAPSPAPATVTASPSAPTVVTGATPPATAGAQPPAASLAAEGGDPVVGQLGTYVWRDGGSDSPWLPGARIAVGTGEPLTVTLDPSVGVATWTARSVPASADGPAGAVVVGRGTGRPAFTAPAPGAWTIELRVVFADDLGSASYFWRLEIS